MTPEQRRFLRAHLLSSGIAGETATTRENTVSNAEKLAAGDPDKHLGIGARGRDAQGVMDAVAALCGCSPSLDERAGGGVIDPDLVLAAHGWAGAAIVRGVETVCFTDVNDPALAVAKADGLVDIVVPCDDNLPPVAYEPVRDYLASRLN